MPEDTRDGSCLTHSIRREMAHALHSILRIREMAHALHSMKTQRQHQTTGHRDNIATHASCLTQHEDTATTSPDAVMPDTASGHRDALHSMRTQRQHRHPCLMPQIPQTLSIDTCHMPYTHTFSVDHTCVCVCVCG
jgi:hypothetical protein